MLHQSSKSFGQRRLNLLFGLRLNLTWKFHIDDVKTAIIGYDFLKAYDLHVDMRRANYLIKQL